MPEVGRRGGLGRTLLTAFLVMVILPLSIVSAYATSRSRQIIQEGVIGKLASIATLKEAQLARWLEEEASLLGSAEFDSSIERAVMSTDAMSTEIRSQLAAAANEWGFSTLALVNTEGLVEWSSTISWEGLSLPLMQNSASANTAWVVLAPTTSSSSIELILLSPSSVDSRWPYIAVLDLRSPVGTLQETAGLGDTGEIYLVNQTGMALPQGRQLSSSAINAATEGEHGEGLHTNYDEVPVIGVYRWLPTLGLALVVEQAQEEAFAGNDALATAVIAATLAVALVTVFTAALVTRQITQPVVKLTESALHIATGDLSQRVKVTSRDEIGILAHVFNRMTADLEALYNDLEAKVVERTKALQQANYQIQRRAIQMQASLEVGQVVTSILDPDRLLEQIVQVVRKRFVYSFAAVYTVNDKNDHLILRASDGEGVVYEDGIVPVDHPCPIGNVYREAQASVESQPITVTVGPPTPYMRSEAALPLLLGNRTLGVLDVQTTGQESFDQDDVTVLRNVANQITIALENAGAYAKERRAAEILRELDESKRRFLSNMSHELRTPLNNIIGFSRLMLKGISGKLSEQQQHDVQIVYDNGHHLLGLINDLLDISQLEAGLMELQFREVDLAELIRSVMATASALVRDKDIVLRGEISPELPMLQADPTRIRQVLLRLLANAAKFTEEGSITVQAHPTDGQIMVSVSDTGVGIASEDQARIFERFEQGVLEDGRRPNGAGLGLALSREFVEMHGGEIWAEGELNKGSIFTFTLPISPVPSGTEATDQESSGESK